MVISFDTEGTRRAQYLAHFMCIAIGFFFSANHKSSCLGAEYRGCCDWLLPSGYIEKKWAIARYGLWHLLSFSIHVHMISTILCFLRVGPVDWLTGLPLDRENRKNGKDKFPAGKLQGICQNTCLCVHIVLSKCLWTSTRFLLFQGFPFVYNLPYSRWMQYQLFCYWPVAFSNFMNSYNSLCELMLFGHWYWWRLII
jgi:hypothetical protein